MTDKFKVSITGIPDNSDPDNVIQNLSRLFKTDPAKIEALLKKPQAVIKTDLTKEAAEKYKTALEKAGALAKVVPVTPAVSPTPAAPTRPDPAAMRMEREEKPEPKATCPGCGYQAMTLDDPLITAHGGEGECPRCGVVPKKIVQAQKAQAPESFPESEAKMLGAESGSSGGPIVRIELVAVVIFALVGGWYFFTRDKAPQTARKPNAVDKARAVVDSPEEGPAETKSSSILIPPGQTQTITLTGPVLYMHKPEGGARIDGEFGIAQDECSKYGIQVYLNDSYIYSEQFPIWTAGSKIANLETGKETSVYQPVRVSGRLYQLPWNSEPLTSPVTPIEVNDPLWLRSRGELSLEDVKKKWHLTPDERVFGYEQRSYAFYFFTATFTVSVPPIEDLPALEKFSKRNSVFVSFGPTKLIFSNGDSQKVLVSGKAKRQINVGFSVYNLTGQYKGVHVRRGSSRGYTLTSD